MICPKCGAQNADGNQFCQNCGEVFAAQAQQPMGQQPMGQQPAGQQMMYSAPVYGQPAQTKTSNPKKTKMIILISACAAVIAAVLIVLFVVILPNTGLKGKVRHKWTVTDSGMTATYDFKNNNVEVLGFPVPFEWSVVGDDRISITVSFLGESETQEFIVSFSSDGKQMIMTDPTGATDPVTYTRAD